MNEEKADRTRVNLIDTHTHFNFTIRNNRITWINFNSFNQTSRNDGRNNRNVSWVFFSLDHKQNLWTKLWIVTRNNQSRVGAKIEWILVFLSFRIMLSPLETQSKISLVSVCARFIQRDICKHVSERKPYKYSTEHDQGWHKFLLGCACNPINLDINSM